MKDFMLGVLATIIVLAGGAFVFLRLGFLDPRASLTPSKVEMDQAMEFLNAAVARHAPRRSNPFPASETNLRDGMPVYEARCAACHGDSKVPRSAIGLALYHRAPQFLASAPDMPEYQNFFIIRNGIRWTEMPSWSAVLTEDEFWKLTAFLASMEKLPPAVDQEWKQGQPAAQPRSAGKEKGAKSHE